MPESVYRIGEIARRTGLSVRALRHYDDEGLLRPTSRTDAGHRLYSAADVERLQRIVSLRALGLPISDIRDALETADPLGVVERHLALVRARIETQTRLAVRLGALADQLRRAGAASLEDLFGLITLTTMFEKHFTPEQLDALKARAETVGADRIAAVQQEWADLFAEFDARRESGVAPEADEVAPLVARAQALIGEFTGGDAGIRSSLNEAVAQNQDATAQAWVIAPELAAYYSRAMGCRASA